MIRLRVELSDEIKVWTDEIRESVKGADKAMKAQLDRIVKVIQPGVQRDLLALTPGPVKLPIQWTSEKQRRAFFATKGFGKGIPYRRGVRENSLMGGWRLRKYVSKRGNLLTATNEAYAYKFVVEDPAEPRAWQQFHKNTGWPNSGQVDDVFDKYAEMAETILLDAWIDYWGV